MNRCAYCHADPAEGFAFIGDERFCHGDGPGPSCYELAQMPEAEWLAALDRWGLAK